MRVVFLGQNDLIPSTYATPIFDEDLWIVPICKVRLPGFLAINAFSERDTPFCCYLYQ